MSTAQIRPHLPTGDYEALGHLFSANLQGKDKVRVPSIKVSLKRDQYMLGTDKRRALRAFIYSKFYLEEDEARRRFLI